MKIYYRAWYDGPRGTCYRHFDTLEDAQKNHPKYNVPPARIDKIEIIYLDSRPEYGTNAG